MAAPGIQLFQIHVAELAEPSFVRSDCNADSNLDLADAVFLLCYLYQGGIAPGCPDACDANSDGLLDCADAMYQLSHYFAAGEPPSDPYPSCGQATLQVDSECIQPACGD